MLTILIIYLIFAVVWAVFGTYKTRQMGNLGKLSINQVKAFFINFFLFPYCLYIAFRDDKF